MGPTDASSFSHVGSGATRCVFPGKSMALAGSGQLTRPHELPSDGIYHEAVGHSMMLMVFIDQALCWRGAAPEASSEVRMLACGKRIPALRLSTGEGEGRETELVGEQSGCHVVWSVTEGSAHPRWDRPSELLEAGTRAAGLLFPHPPLEAAAASGRGCGCGGSRFLQPKAVSGDGLRVRLAAGRAARTGAVTNEDNFGGTARRPGPELHQRDALKEHNV